MTQPYLDDLAELIATLGDRAEPGADITCKHFFSGAAAYADDVIFMSLSPVGLALKLPDEDCISLLEQGGKPLQYFPEAPVKKGYVVLPAVVARDSDLLAVWISRSIAFVSL